MLDSATTMQHMWQHFKYTMEQILTAIPARLLYCVTIVVVLKMQLSEAKEAFTMRTIVGDSLAIHFSFAVTFLLGVQTLHGT